MKLYKKVNNKDNESWTVYFLERNGWVPYRGGIDEASYKKMEHLLSEKHLVILNLGAESQEGKTLTYFLMRDIFPEFTIEDLKSRIIGIENQLFGDD